MTLIESGGCLVGVIGLAAGTKIGYDFVGGIAGGVLGGVVGAAGGVVLGTAMVVVPLLLGVVWERWQKRRALGPRFGRYWTHERRADWIAVKDRTAGGKVVRGKVVAEMPYGRFLDIACGFPALLKAVEDGAPVPDLPPAGSEAEARVLDFDDYEREVVLTRRERQWIVFEAVPVGYLVSAIQPDGTATYFPITNSAHARFRKSLEHDDVVPGELSGPDGPAAVSFEWRQGHVVRIAKATPTEKGPS